MYPKMMNYKIWKDRLHKKIVNLESLPGGLGCNYLVLIGGQDDILIAKQWARKKPQLKDNEYLIIF